MRFQWELLGLGLQCDNMLPQERVKEKGKGEEVNTHRYWVNRGDGDCEVFLGVPGGLLNTLARDMIPNRIVDIRSSECSNHQLLSR